MKRHYMQDFFLVFFGVVLSMTGTYAVADDPLVYISAFASGNDGAIHVYRLDMKSGQLKLVERMSDVEQPFFLALSPDGKFLYSIHSPEKFGGKTHEQVAAYAIEGVSGKMKLLNRQSALGAAACYLDVDATGKTVVVANYSTGSVAAFPVQGDGSLGKSASFVQHAGSSVNSSRQEGPHAHSIVVSPDNKFVYAADLGLDKIMSYKLDPASARLTPNRQPFVRTLPGAGPRHLIFDPSGKHVFVINELSNSVTAFAYDSKSGMLIELQTISTLPDDFEGTSHCADLKITPDGQFLYGTNRGHDSIAMYRIGAHGRLTLLGIEPSLGKGPQNLAITSDGKLLICANMAGNNVSVFRIEGKSGGLVSVGEPVSMSGPSCILLK